MLITKSLKPSPLKRKALISSPRQISTTGKRVPLKKQSRTDKNGGKLGLGRIKTKKVPRGTPAWVKAIPMGKHGSGHLQKRLWRLKSDFVRIRDWTAFGTFIDTGEPIRHWNDAQAGHYRSYAECRGMFKFHEMNIHAQTAQGNSWPTSTTWENYRNNLTARYNPEYIAAIDASNKNWPVHITTEMVWNEIERTIHMISMLETKPPYWNRMIKLRAHYEHLLKE